MTLAASLLRWPSAPVAGAAAHAAGRFDSRHVEVGRQSVAALRHDLRTTPELTSLER